MRGPLVSSANGLRDFAVKFLCEIEGFLDGPPQWGDSPVVRRVLLLIVLSGCSASTEKNPLALPMTTVGLPCVVEKGQALTDDVPSKGDATMTMGGPHWCLRALRVFLRDRPSVHVVDILPLEYPTDPDNRAWDPGTQELLVRFANEGPWPEAASLEVFPLECTADRKIMNQPTCASVMESDGARERIVIWVPLSERETRTGTFQLLAIARKTTQ
jgi:hypothetical protein